METIVTISGPAGHGKDTAGAYLKEELEKKGKRVMVIGFGDYLKLLASKHFGYKGEQYKSQPDQRSILQKVGTEIGRKHDPDFWMGVVRSTIVAFQDEFDICVITDARFPNECEILRGKFDLVNLKVLRRNFDNSLTEEQKQHASETALNFFNFDAYIDSSNLAELHEKLNMFIEKFLMHKPRSVEQPKPKK